MGKKCKKKIQWKPLTINETPDDSASKRKYHKSSDRNGDTQYSDEQNNAWRNKLNNGEQVEYIEHPHQETYYQNDEYIVPDGAGGAIYQNGYQVNRKHYLQERRHYNGAEFPNHKIMMNEQRSYRSFDRDRHRFINGYATPYPPHQQQFVHPQHITHFNGPLNVEYCPERRRSFHVNSRVYHHPPTFTPTHGMVPRRRWSGEEEVQVAFPYSYQYQEDGTHYYDPNALQYEDTIQYQAFNQCSHDSGNGYEAGSSETQSETDGERLQQHPTSRVEIDNDQYTKIQTPRQEVLFKKSPSNVTTVSVTSSEDNCPAPETPSEASIATAPPATKEDLTNESTKTSENSTTGKKNQKKKKNKSSESESSTKKEKNSQINESKKKKNNKNEKKNESKKKKKAQSDKKAKKNTNKEASKSVKESEKETTKEEEVPADQLIDRPEVVDDSVHFDGLDADHCLENEEYQDGSYSQVPPEPMVEEVPLAGVVMQQFYPGGPVMSIPVHWTPYLDPNLVPGQTASTALAPSVTRILDKSFKPLDPNNWDEEEGTDSCEDTAEGAIIPDAIIPLQHDEQGCPITVQVKVDENCLPLEISPNSLVIQLSSLQQNHLPDCQMYDYCDPQFRYNYYDPNHRCDSHFDCTFDEGLEARLEQKIDEELAKTYSDEEEKTTDKKEKNDQDDKAARYSEELASCDSQYASMSEGSSLPTSPAGELSDSPTTCPPNTPSSTSSGEHPLTAKILEEEAIANSLVHEVEVLPKEVPNIYEEPITSNSSNSTSQSSIENSVSSCTSSSTLLCPSSPSSSSTLSHFSPPSPPLVVQHEPQDNDINFSPSTQVEEQSHGSTTPTGELHNDSLPEKDGEEQGEEAGEEISSENTVEEKGVEDLRDESDERLEEPMADQTQEDGGAVRVKSGYVLVPVLTPYYDPNVLYGYPNMMDAPSERQYSSSNSSKKKKKKQRRRNYESTYIDPELYAGDPLIVTPEGYFFQMDPSQVAYQTCGPFTSPYQYQGPHYNYYSQQTSIDEGFQSVEHSPYIAENQTDGKETDDRFGVLHEEERQEIEDVLLDEGTKKENSTEAEGAAVDSSDSGVSEVEENNQPIVQKEIVTEVCEESTAHSDTSEILEKSTECLISDVSEVCTNVSEEIISNEVGESNIQIIEKSDSDEDVETGPNSPEIEKVDSNYLSKSLVNASFVALLESKVEKLTILMNEQLPSIPESSFESASEDRSSLSPEAESTSCFDFNIEEEEATLINVNNSTSCSYEPENEVENSIPEIVESDSSPSDNFTQLETNISEESIEDLVSSCQITTSCSETSTNSLIFKDIVVTEAVRQWVDENSPEKVFAIDEDSCLKLIQNSEFLNSIPDDAQLLGSDTSTEPSKNVMGNPFGATCSDDSTSSAKRVAVNSSSTESVSGDSSPKSEDISITCRCDPKECRKYYNLSGLDDESMSSSDTNLRAELVQSAAKCSDCSHSTTPSSGLGSSLANTPTNSPQHASANSPTSTPSSPHPMLSPQVALQTADSCSLM